MAFSAPYRGASSRAQQPLAAPQPAMLPSKHSTGGSSRPLQPVTAPQQPASPSKQSKQAVKGKGKLTEQYGDPPLHIKSQTGDRRLRRGPLLGSGGFARAYQVTDEDDGSLLAVKVISKEQLQSTKNRAKLFAEIKLHQAMDHPRVVHFDACFEDEGNVYMTLQLCSGGSLLDILRKRKVFTEPEARFFLVQLIGACEYMHGRSVIHRDLKLGNLLLDADMNICVADFGLAALVRFPGERKKTICGTPNYIAPEILFDSEHGHSFEVDVWSLGVILYTLLIGKPPFQTKDVKVIYKKIKGVNYTFPDDADISDEAVDLIGQILNRDPRSRPTLEQILAHEFFHCGVFPESIPAFAVERAPDFSKVSSTQSATNFARIRNKSRSVPSPETPAAPPVRTISLEAAEAAQSRVDRETEKVLAPQSPIAELLRSARKPLQVSPSNSQDLRRKVLEKENAHARSTSASPVAALVLKPKNGVTRSESGLVKTVTIQEPRETKRIKDVAKLPSRELYESVLTALELALESPRRHTELANYEPSRPRVFITAWVDYTQKYGVAYALTDGTAGFYFNDASTMALSPNKERVDYIASKEGSSTYVRRSFTMHGDEAPTPKSLERKVYLLQYFDEYMAGTLDRDASWCFRDSERVQNLDFLVKFYRMKEAIIFKLSNGVLQFNFFDHTKILLADSGHNITLINSDGQLKTFLLAKLVREKLALEAIVDLDEKRQQKLTQTRFVLGKLRYAAKVLRELSVDVPETA